MAKLSPALIAAAAPLLPYAYTVWAHIHDLEMVARIIGISIRMAKLTVRNVRCPWSNSSLLCGYKVI